MESVGDLMQWKKGERVSELRDKEQEVVLDKDEDTSNSN